VDAKVGFFIDCHNIFEVFVIMQEVRRRNQKANLKYPLLLRDLERVVLQGAWGG
jgi:hypothetical protein